MEAMRDRLNKLESLGYTTNFSVQNGKLYDENHTPIDIENIKIDGTYRIEVDSDPSQQTIIYALSTLIPNKKGTIINGYGPYSDPEKDALIDLISPKEVQKASH